MQNSRSSCSCLWIQAEKLLLLLMALGVMSMLLSVHTVILLSIKSTTRKIKLCGYEIKMRPFAFLKKKSYIHLKVTLWHQLDGLPSNKHPIMGLRPNTQGNLVIRFCTNYSLILVPFLQKKILPSTKYHIQSRSAFAKPPLWQTQPQYIKDK